MPTPIPLPQVKKAPKTARGQQTLHRLLDAAESEFGARGFHEASVAGITAAAGIAHGTFYIYFDSKEDLFRALVEDLGQRLRDHLAVRVGAAATRIEAEREGLRSFILFVRDHPNLYRVVMEAQFVDEAAFRRYFTDFGLSYRANLEAAARRGEIRDGDDEARSCALMGMALFMGLRFGIWEPGRPVDPLVDGVMDMIAGGLAA